jgi:hypothetical protein
MTSKIAEELRAEAFQVLTEMKKSGKKGFVALSPERIFEIANALEDSDSKDNHDALESWDEFDEDVEEDCQ